MIIFVEYIHFSSWSQKSLCLAAVVNLITNESVQTIISKKISQFKKYIKSTIFFFAETKRTKYKCPKMNFHDRQHFEGI